MQAAEAATGLRRAAQSRTRAAAVPVLLMLCAALLASADDVGGGGEIVLEPASRVEPAHPGVPLLWAWRDSALQRELDTAMERLELTPALAGSTLSVALVDITDRRRPRLAAVNGDKMFYAASLPKIVVMLAVFEKAGAGELTIDEETRQELDRMIRISSNSDATALMQKVGKEYIGEVVRSPRYGLYDAEHNGGLWAGKDYASGGLWRRDPMSNLSHGATAIQVARFFYLLEMGRLVSPSASLEMKQILERKGPGQKFLKGLRRARPDARIHRKGGTWRNFHADGALVERSDGAAYIAAALVESEDGREWLEQIAFALDGLVAPPRPAAAVDR